MATLLRDCITSYDLLEVLIFLHAHREEGWSKGRLAERIYVPLDHIASALEHLTGHGLLLKETGQGTLSYRYAAAEPLQSAVEELARLFVEQRAALMSVMSANAIERVRLRAPAAFANAFALRKKPEDG